MMTDRYLRVRAESDFEGLPGDEDIENEDFSNNGVPSVSTKYAWNRRGQDGFRALQTKETDHLESLGDVEEQHDQEYDDEDHPKIGVESHISQHMRPTPSSQHEGLPPSVASSFDLDEEDDLQRYNIDFSVRKEKSHLQMSGSLEESIEQRKLSFSLVWFAFLQTRDQTRQRRVERMLSVNNDIERAQVNFQSWCDLYDRGLFLLLPALLVWLIICNLLHKTWFAVGGLLFLVLRISLRPAYWFFRGRHVARRQQASLQMYDEINAIGVELRTDKEENGYHDDVGTSPTSRS